MLPAPQTAKILADNVNLLLSTLPNSGPRPVIAARMGLGDKTLGYLKAGTGNPTLESIEKVATYFKREPWQLLKPNLGQGATGEMFDPNLMAKSLELCLQAFHDADRIPSNRQLSSAAAFVYGLLLKGVHLDQATLEVNSLIERAGSSAKKLAGTE